MQKSKKVFLLNSDFTWNEKKIKEFSFSRILNNGKTIKKTKKSNENFVANMGFLSGSGTHEWILQFNHENDTSIQDPSRWVVGVVCEQKQISTREIKNNLKVS